MKTKAILIYLILIALAATCSAATITVHADGSGDYPTIQAAIDAAIEGDIIELTPGAYTGPGNRDIDFLGKAITVRSENGPNNCFIFCFGTEAEPHRGFYFHSGEDANSIIEGISIALGYAALGGGVCCEQSSPTVTNCIFYGNSAVAGGGISCDDSSSPKIADCTFTYNTAYAGGGIYNRENSNPTVTNCTFNGNSAIVYQGWAIGYGGGMCNVNSDPIVNNCTFIDNLAKKYGGGICNYNSSSPKVSDCTFNGNVAEDVGRGYGGGMMNWQGSKPEVTNCVFKNNRSAVYGGGIHNRNGSNPTVTECTFINNLSGRGGGMHNWKSSPMVNKCIFSSNAATDSRYVVWGRGGGMSNFDSSPRVKNCLFSNNSAQGMYPFLSATGGMDNDGGAPVITNCIFVGNSVADGVGGMNNHGGSSPSVTNCILWNNSPSQISGSSPLVSFSSVQGGYPGEGNINLDPCFIEPGYWDGDIWVDGDYHLLPSSPCINAGDPNYIADPNETDLDGQPRIFLGRVDIGADEFVPSLKVPMHFTPRSLNPKSKGKWIKAHLVLPEGFSVEDVNTNSPARLIEPFMADSNYMDVFINEDGLVKIMAAFDRAVFCSNGSMLEDIVVIAQLTTGQYFYGTDTIRIKTNNLKYLAVLTSHWLAGDCGEPDWCAGADLNRDSVVDFIDFAFFDGCCLEFIKN